MLFGRLKIYTLYEEVNDANIVEILSKSLAIHLTNVDDIEYLYNYYKGIQPILFREKQIRPEINNKIVENHANSIVQFKAGYLLEKPIQYVARKEEVDNESIAFLNDNMTLECKETRDKEIANWQAICGLGYRLSLPNKNYDGNNSPFRIYKTDPRNCFVVYTTAVGNEPVLGVITYLRKNEKGDDELVCQAYSKDKYYEWVKGEETAKSTSHILGGIPLIEYPFNQDRIGAFEVVLHLLDSANRVVSNALDGIEQFIQALLIFKNVDINREDLTALLELGAIKIKDDGTIEASVEYLTKELNQEQTLKLQEHILDMAYYIAGTPRNKNNGTVGNSQGAVIMRDGWSNIEAKMQETELMFKESERQFLNLALNYTRILTGGKYKLKSSELDIKFTRRNYENIYQKTQVLTMMLSQPKIAPRLAFEVCGLFGDSEGAYNESEEYYRKQLELMQNQANNNVKGEKDNENQPNNP